MGVKIAIFSVIGKFFVAVVFFLPIREAWAGCITHVRVWLFAFFEAERLLTISIIIKKRKRKVI